MHPTLPPHRPPRRRRCRALAPCAGLLLGTLLLRLGLEPGRRRAGCVTAPPSWRRLDGTRSSRDAAPQPTAQPIFLMLWSTNASLFGLVSRRAVESIFYHHPRSSLTVFSNTLPPEFFAPLASAGFDVRVARFNLSAVLAGTPAMPWLTRLVEWQRGNYYYSHVTDVLRLALLYREGGVYLDSDVLLLRPLRIARVPSTLSNPPPEGAASAALRNSIGIEAYAGAWIQRPILNGAVLVFEAGSPFLWNALAEFSASYNPRLWGWNGPELLTRVHSRCRFEGSDAVQMEPPEAFYPLYWKDTDLFMSAKQLDLQEHLWRSMRRNSYAVHLWNRKTARLRADRRSLMHRLLHQFVVRPGWARGG